MRTYISLECLWRGVIKVSLIVAFKKLRYFDLLWYKNELYRNLNFNLRVFNA